MMNRIAVVRNLVCVSVVWLFAACVVAKAPEAAGPKAVSRATADLAGAIAKLKSESSYGWTVSIESQGEGGFRAGPIVGRVERDGKSHVTMDYGRRKVQVVIDGDIAAVTNRDGKWETVSLLDQGYRSAGFAASIAQSVSLPVDESIELLDSLMYEKKMVCFVGI